MLPLRFLRFARARIGEPFHRRELQRRIATRRAPMMVPFYHRVADRDPGPWTISRDQFARQVEHCAQHLTPVTLADVQRNVRGGRCDRPTFTFTFDDGYAENVEFALPLLVERKIPCVYFVTVANVLSGRPFAHDVDRGCPLPVNTVAHLRDMLAGGIEIGLHARDHVDFSQVDSEAQIDGQIAVAKDQLEQAIGTRVRYFAFPYGMPPQLTTAAIAAVGRANLDGFCSAFGAYNLPGRDAPHIRRFHGDRDFNRFRNWISFDRRKVNDEPKIEYHWPPPTDRGKPDRGEPDRGKPDGGAAAVATPIGGLLPAEIPPPKPS